MCVSFCHRKQILYFNHEDCRLSECEYAAVDTHGLCARCRHRQGVVCGLTGASLPEKGGCCHGSVKRTLGSVRVSEEMVALLRGRPNETVKDIVQAYDVPYDLDERTGAVFIELDEVVKPDIYGQGTEPVQDDQADWG